MILNPVIGAGSSELKTASFEISPMFYGITVPGIDLTKRQFFFVLGDGTPYPSLSVNDACVCFAYSVWSGGSQQYEAVAGIFDSDHVVLMSGSITKNGNDSTVQFDFPLYPDATYYTLYYV